MLTERLKARCASARPIGAGFIRGFRLAFAKPGVDQSGKATIVPACENTRVYGVLFNLDKSDVPVLDKFESSGVGYSKLAGITVGLNSQKFEAPAFTYIAKSIHHDMRPYDWYLDLILAGARQHELSKSYIDGLADTPARRDHVVTRSTRVEAMGLLREKPEI